MQVLLDGQPIRVDDPTLAGAMNAARSAAESRGRVVVEIKADGQPLPSSALENPAGAGPYASVQFISADPLSLVSGSLSDGAEALQAVKAVHQAAAASVQAGDTTSGLAQLQEALRTWGAVRDLVEQTARLLGLDLATLVIPGAHGEITFDHAVTLMVTRLKEVQGAVQREDWAALSDIVGYDLDALADVWIGLLNGLSAHVRRLGGQGRGESRGGNG